MIFEVSRVFTDEFVSFTEFTGADIPRRGTSERRRVLLRDIARSVERSGAELYGGEARDLGELYERLIRSNELFRVEAAGERPVAPVTLARVGSVRDAAARVVEFANYEYVRRAFRVLFGRLAVGGLVVAVGVAVYVFKTGQAPPKPPAVAAPISVRLSLVPGARRWARILGPACPLGSVPAVAVGGALTSPVVVTENADGCRAVQISLRAKDGVAVPVTEPASGPPGNVAP
jgi:hypothetical protein